MESYCVDQSVALGKSTITLFAIMDESTYVPQNEELRNDIIKAHHDPVIMGHPGCLKTLELVNQDYYWPGMTSNISKWVEGCALCQQMKINTHPTTPGIMPIKSHTTCPF